MRKLFSFCVVAVLIGLFNGCGQTANKAAIAAFNKGQKAHENKDFHSALIDYTKAIKLDPKYAAAYTNRGKAYGSLEKYPEAIADFTKAIELDPKDVASYCTRGLMYAILKKLPEAISNYTKAIELDPKDVVTYYLRGVMYSNLKNYPEAIADYTKAIELDPKYVDAFNFRGYSNGELKKYPEAIADYTKVIELDPKYVDAYNNRGNAYKALGKTIEAEADFAEAKEAVVVTPMRVKLGDHEVFYIGVRLEVLNGPVYDGWCSGFSGPFSTEFKKTSGRALSKGLLDAAAATAWDVTLKGVFPELGDKELQKLLNDPDDPRWKTWEKEVPNQNRRILDAMARIKVKITQYPELSYEE